eukprot:scaffold905_cov363-Pavlova_lutheri.AAC.11
MGSRFWSYRWWFHVFREVHVRLYPVNGPFIPEQRFRWTRAPSFHIGPEDRSTGRWVFLSASPGLSCGHPRFVERLFPV